ncbi:hypothetical protein [Agilicoccus flavus]|uniref:hypothetical protein n=1 Tax=Agilicoccus flavus TaxID=2775968 RepID=UPI001CF62B62|nr:hypothetical protein [Agilicoccus flavus]
MERLRHVDLMRLVAPLDVPSDGTVELDGADEASMTRSALNRARNSTCGVVFQ